MTRASIGLLFAAGLGASAGQTSTRPTTQPATQPATRPALVSMFHGGPGHWCQVCAAAAARQAEQGRAAGDHVGDAPAQGADLITDLPPR